jgi:hypothetical protein
MIGNGVDCWVAKAIGIEAAYHLMMSRLGANSNRPAPVQTESWMDEGRSKWSIFIRFRRLNFPDFPCMGGFSQQPHRCSGGKGRPYI